MISKAELVRRFKNACASVCAAEAELTEIDARFGDADHGFTMVKICNTIVEALDAADGNIKEMLDDAAMAVMHLNGGSAVPLWNTWLDGMQEGAPESDEMDTAALKEIIEEYEGEDEAGLFAAAAKAAEEGAENSKNFPSKFGRAKSYGTKTIGTPDAGAMSMAYFFKGLVK